MAGKNKTIYICRECGGESIGWMGKCPSCGAWNTLEEQVVAVKPAAQGRPSALAAGKPATARQLIEISVVDEHRYRTGIGELDRVLGGGIVKGSVVLLSGDPGIGKSTILLQICASIDPGLKLLYVSGEESAVQLKLRAGRLGVENPQLYLMAENDARAVADYIQSFRPDLVMIDSIQTMRIEELPSSAGSVVQVRECTNLLLQIGKSLDIPILLVGHVNKGGEIAGPKVLEHIVDTVLYFEGERNQFNRLLRAIKNRYGSTNEIGVFEMTDAGLTEVENPSQMLLSGRLKNTSGSCVACVTEGTRPLLAEVQGLVSTTGFGNARRMAIGFDYNRLNLLLAVLEKRIGLHFSTLDTYLNVVGGLRLDEPAADLPVILSLASALRDVPLPDDLVAFGEVGLSGETRSVPRAAVRVAECARLGFHTCVLPKACLKQVPKNVAESISLVGVRTVREALDLIR